jgi:hypothetical protein
MLLVRGMDAVDRKKPDWREYFSIYGEGQIDLRTVFKDVLLAVTGASESDVNALHHRTRWRRRHPRHRGRPPHPR